MTENQDLERLLDIETQIAALEVQREALLESTDPTALITARLYPIFAAFPQLKTLGWIQYVPYFNDGDPCRWTINGPAINPMTYDEYMEAHDDDEDAEDEYYDSEQFDTWSFEYSMVKNADSDDPYYVAQRAQFPDFDRDSAAAILEALKPIETWLANSERHLDKLFGHAKVIARRDGTVSVEEYNHD